MKLVFDNIIFSIQKSGGISVYWSELIKRFIDSDICFYECHSENIFRERLDLVTQEEIGIAAPVLRYLPFTRQLPTKSVFHSSYYRFSLQSDIVNITTVHDFTYEHHFRVGLPRIVHAWQKKSAINRSNGIICVSENTRKDLIKFYPNINPEMVKVIYNGVGSAFYPINNRKLSLKGRLSALAGKAYLMYVGDRSAYKNFEVVVGVLRELVDFVLVAVGKPFTKKEQTRFSDVIERIVCFSGVDDRVLNVLYNNAFCFVYPSSYEGFGIPVAEAMSAGCPVISSNLSSIPEVAGESALLIDSISVQAILEKVSQLRDEGLRRKLMDMGFRQAKKFSWDRCARETYAFYKETYKRKFG